MLSVQLWLLGTQHKSYPAVPRAHGPADMKEDGAPSAALPLSVTQTTSNTLRSTIAKLGKHQTMTMTSVSRSTGRSDKAKRAQGNQLGNVLVELLLAVLWVIAGCCCRAA